MTTQNTPTFEDLEFRTMTFVIPAHDKVYLKGILLGEEKKAIEHVKERKVALTAATVRFPNGYTAFISTIRVPDGDPILFNPSKEAYLFMPVLTRFEGGLSEDFIAKLAVPELNPIGPIVSKEIINKCMLTTSRMKMSMWEKFLAWTLQKSRSILQRRT